ncbi:hypothetical protein Tco_0741381 [Tanacetum coccineum]
MGHSSTESKTSLAIAANLSELELKKILIEKMESNKSIYKSDEQKNLYKALVDAYESGKLILDTYGDTVSFKRRRDDEDKDEEPFAGSNRGSKRRRAGKEPESTSTPKEKEPKSTGKSTEGSKSLHKSAGEFAHAEEPTHIAKDLEEPVHQELPSPDRDWNKTLPTNHGPVQPWQLRQTCTLGISSLGDANVNNSMYLSANRESARRRLQMLRLQDIKEMLFPFLFKGKLTKSQCDESYQRSSTSQSRIRTDLISYAGIALYSIFPIPELHLSEQRQEGTVDAMEYYNRQIWRRVIGNEQSYDPDDQQTAQVKEDNEKFGKIYKMDSKKQKITAISSTKAEYITLYLYTAITKVTLLYVATTSNIPDPSILTSDTTSSKSKWKMGWLNCISSEHNISWQISLPRHWDENDLPFLSTSLE